VPTFVKDILELAVAIELESAAVYEVFARTFSKDGDLSCFWRLYAEAERYHAASIRIHQATFGELPVAGDRFPAEVADSQRFFDRLRAWRQDFERTPPPLGVAFDVAQQIESHTAELHGRTQFFALYPRFQDLFLRMTEEDLGHREMLIEARARFSVTPG
jgi:hypothetical protein